MENEKEPAMEKSENEEVKLTEERKKEMAEIRARAQAKIGREQMIFSQRTAGSPLEFLGWPDQEIYRDEFAEVILKVNEEMEAEIEEVRKKGSNAWAIFTRLSLLFSALVVELAPEKMKTDEKGID